MIFQFEGRVAFFATGNINKFNEARKILAEYGIAVGMLKVKSLEIQSDSLEEIARASVLDAFEKCRLPLIVEDAGLFVEVLNGFPGPYAAYVYRTIGNKGLLQLMENEENRKARFRSTIAYYTSGLGSPVLFSGEVEGVMVREVHRGNGLSGFGFDPIFKPINSDRTFAEMSLTEKNRYSHRADALRKFADWYGKRK